ncbi:MAG: hypothetical protein RLZZ611_1129 [Cyanobacteriota bacterium]|jgi:hypothetical protein
MLRASDRATPPRGHHRTPEDQGVIVNGPWCDGCRQCAPSTCVQPLPLEARLPFRQGRPWTEDPGGEGSLTEGTAAMDTYGVADATRKRPEGKRHQVNS